MAEPTEQPHCKLDAAITWARAEVTRRREAKEWAAAEHLLHLQMAAECLHEIERARRAGGGERCD
jgi:hypothetical protein